MYCCADRKSPRSVRCSTSDLMNACRQTVSVSQTTARWRRARVTATLIRRSSAKNPTSPVVNINNHTGASFFNCLLRNSTFLFPQFFQVHFSMQDRIQKIRKEGASDKGFDQEVGFGCPERQAIRGIFIKFSFKGGRSQLAPPPKSLRDMISDEIRNSFVLREDAVSYSIHHSTQQICITHLSMHNISNISYLGIYLHK